MNRLFGALCAAVTAASAALVAFGAPDAPAGAAATSDFSLPCCVASDGTNVWVANTGNNSVVELSAATGAVEQVLTGSQYGFRRPVAITIDGGDVWVASEGNGLTELSETTGGLVRVIGGGNNPFPYYFRSPVALAGNGTDIWVLSIGSGAAGRLTEIDESTGAMVRLVEGSRYQLKTSLSVAVNGSELMVADNAAPYRVTTIDATTGNLVRVVRSPKSNFLNQPLDISVDNGDAWVVDEANMVTEMSAAGRVLRLVTKPEFNVPVAIDAVGPAVWVVNHAGSVTELAAATGALVRIVSAGDFSNPSAVSSDGTDVWVTNSGTDTVTEINALTGGIVQVIHG